VVFVGRAREVRLLEGLLDSVACGGSAAVITGEAGIGKTFLLEHLAARTALPVRWVRGTESESAVPFASAADLLLPLRRRFASLLDAASPTTAGDHPPHGAHPPRREATGW
jgi:MoxR-like ATPase